MVKYILFWVFLSFTLHYGVVKGEDTLMYTEPYRFNKIGIKDGLSHNQVNSFLKDKMGYLWVGTASGLNRCDGYNIKVFTHNPVDDKTLNSNSIYKLFLDPEGELWVKTLEGLNVYNPIKEQFSQDIERYLKKYNLPDYDLEEIISDGRGDFWFLHKNGRLSHYNPLLKKTKAVDLYLDEGKKVSDIVSDLYGNIWFVFTNGLVEKRDGESLEVIESFRTIYNKYGAEDLYYQLMADRDGDIWISLPDERRGVFFLDNSQNKLSHIHKDSKGVKLNSDLVSSVIEGEDGHIWIGTDHGGINLLNKKTGQVSHILHDNNEPNSLSHNSIYALYKDIDGIIWVGTYKNGFNYFHKNNIRFSHYKHHKSLKKSLPFNDVNRFAEDEKGNLWIGTNGGGLVYMDRTKQDFTQYTQSNSKGISSDVVVSLLYDSQNTLWVGTYFGGLMRYDGKQFNRVSISHGGGPELIDENIWELFEDSHRNIWIGTLSNGIQFFSRKSMQFEPPPVREGQMMVNTNYIAAIAEDSNGHIWIGGTDGVDIIDPVSGEVKHFRHDFGKGNSLVHDNVLSILKDSKGNIWLGTQGGLSLYDADRYCFKNFTVTDGLPHNTILTLQEDDGQIWMSTPNGLASLQYYVPANRDIVIKHYTEQDGLQDNSFNENAAFKTRAGELVFGGPNGFNIFQPKLIASNQNPPLVVFTEFLLFNNPLLVGEQINGRTILEASLSSTENIVLKHFENVFSVSFAALNFFHPEKNVYKYKLEGFDTDWRLADSQNRQVTYTNLDPGSYVLKVLAANNDGVWSVHPAQLNISVLAPFWLTGTAYVIYFLLAIGLLYIARRMVLNKARDRFQIEQERREARQLHELDLMKIRFLTNISHEFRTPLSLILAPTEKILKEAENDKQKLQFQMINRNARRLLNLVNQLLDFRKIEVEGMELNPSEGNIIKFIKEAVNSFNELSHNKSILLSFKSNVECLFVTFDMDKLEKILFNLLSNAFKFTPEGGAITVKVICEENQDQKNAKNLIIIVKDTGIGIPKENQLQVFERFYTHEVPDTLVNQGSGIGLSITKEFVRLHGGQISLESSPGNGSSFKISLPVKVLENRQEESLAELLEPATITKGEAGLSVVSNKLTLLLIEDNDDFRSYLKSSLGEYFEVDEAKNGNEGWKKALATMPSLIVSDLMMPVMNGIDLCKKIKNDSRTAHIPFILLTAFSGQEQKLEGLQIGANDYVTKPFNFDLLLSRINNLIKQNQLLQQTYEKKVSVKTSQAEITSMDEKFIKKVMEIVEHNFSDPDFSVEFLSKEMGMSRVHLYNKLSTITGKTPIEFIRYMRLQRSLQYLDKSQLSVSEVAYKVGFNSAKTFTKYFKAEFNMIPSAYATSEKNQPIAVK